MPRHNKTESVVDATMSVGVSQAEIEIIVQAACEKAVNVLKQELVKMFSEFGSRLQSVEGRLATLEQKSDDLECRVNDMVDKTPGVPSGQLDDVRAEIEGVRREARAAMCAANDVEQYGRRWNIRIRGLDVGQNDNCQVIVTEFLNRKFQLQTTDQDIEAAHILPTTVSDSQPTAQQRRPTVIVRFRNRILRDAVMRKRKSLKGSQFSIVEDLTSLNARTLTRVSKNPDVNNAWTWNGKIYVLLKNGEKRQVKPYQPVSS